jgi:hypothetical protein
MIRCRKLILAAITVLSFSILVGGCVSVKDRFVGIAERTPGLNPDPGRSAEPRLEDSTVPLLACGLREVSLKEAGFDLDSFWKNSQIVALQEQLERRGAKVVLGAVRLFASPSVKLGFVPFSPEGGIAFEERAGQLNAVALLKQANGTLNIFPDGREELWTLLSASEVENLVATLKKDRAFASFFQGKQIHIAQSVGVQTASKGLLYLAAARDLASRAVMEYYRVQVSRSNNGSQMVPGTLRALCGSGDVQILGAPAGMIMNTVGVYSDSEELVSKNPCMLGLGALACLSKPCYARQVTDLELNDLLMIIKQSPEYQELRAQLLSETPEDAWYTLYSQDAQLAIVAFTLKQDVRDPNDFVVYPSVMFVVDHINKKIQDVMISRVDEATLDRAFLTSLKDPTYHKIVPLNPAITEELREAQQTRRISFVNGNPRTGGQAYSALSAMGPGKNKCICTKRSPGGIDFPCFDRCMAGCGLLCDRYLPIFSKQWIACRLSCAAMCGVGCTKPSICIEYRCWYGPSMPTPMGGSRK